MRGSYTLVIRGSGTVHDPADKNSVDVAAQRLVDELSAAGHTNVTATVQANEALQIKPTSAPSAGQPG